jgi:serine/threonine-protein kinase
MGDEALVGRLLNGRYRIGERIARGGMASVFLGTDERLDRTVAIKVMHRGLGDPAVFTERFKREAKAAAKLNHPNVVSVFDQGHDGDAIYLIMEYVPGHTLRDLMRSGRPMKPSAALEIVDAVLVALAAAHEARLIHRDVKPENVLITPDGDVKVADFGLARAMTAATTATSNTLIGTVSYLAPEIVSNTGADARSDVYAVGAMLYEMLTGAKPHAGESPIQVAYKHVHEDIGPPSALQSAIPPYLDALVARATVRDTSRRAADARVLLQYVRLVRDALAAGLDDDPELTEHLTPPAAGADPGARVLTRATAPTALPPAAQPTEPTVQWNFGEDRLEKDSEEPSSVRSRLGPPANGQAAAPKRRRSRPSRGQFSLIAALAVAVLAAGFGYWLGVGRFVDTPILVGHPETQAAQEARAGGFDFKVVERRFDEKIALDTVMSTDPKPGSHILPGGTIHAVVSKGPERYKVPNLAGASIEQATADLQDLHLVLGKVTRRYSETVAKNKIIGLDGPKPGQLVKRDTPIDVLLSKGGHPVELPNLVGKKRDDAVARLQALHLKVDLRYGFFADRAVGRVGSQSPGPGTAHQGDTVTLVISKGPEQLKVPNVIGMTWKAALQVLAEAGVKGKLSSMGERLKEFDWTVAATDPAVGTTVKNGSTVVIGP